jgi:hypothetical protein
MLKPSCGQKERLLDVYMEAVPSHADTVGLLKSVHQGRDAPKRSVLQYGAGVERFG